MRAIMVMFDSLNRKMLSPYGGKEAITPNFQRLAEKTVTFDKCYVGSMPCMPARRELHTGRYNFLHRSWGPLEPFDDSMPEILKNNGVYTHLVSDHYHYWEEGGATYHTKYSSWELARGQEGDPWKGDVSNPIVELDPNKPRQFAMRQDAVNRQYIKGEEDFPQALTFKKGLQFLEDNVQEQDWFLQIETFDPHEPFFSHEKYQALYKEEYGYDEGEMIWPPYEKVSQSSKEVKHCRYAYKALLSMCDAYLGKILDFMDQHHMWQDTMLIVNTDHGFLLGEHDWWAKCIQPFYQEIAHTPLFIWHPEVKKAGVRNNQLVQTIDLPATLLEFFDLPLPKDMEGVGLAETMENQTVIREGALFGIHGGQVNCTDGKYVYMRGSTVGNAPLYNYTIMPTHMKKPFSIEELQTTELHQGFDFTKGCPVMKIKGRAKSDQYKFDTALYNVEQDPRQTRLLEDPDIEYQMKELMIKIMRENQAPEEQYKRLSLI